MVEQIDQVDIAIEVRVLVAEPAFITRCSCSSSSPFCQVKSTIRVPVFGLGIGSRFVEGWIAEQFDPGLAGGCHNYPSFLFFQSALAGFCNVRWTIFADRRRGRTRLPFTIPVSVRLADVRSLSSA